MSDVSIRNDELPADVALALQRGNKIEAIKLLRLARRIDLKDAKQIVDGAVAQNPRPHARRTDAVDGRGRYVLLLIGALALLAFLYHYLTQG
jgi:hypothetical protein